MGREMDSMAKGPPRSVCAAHPDLARSVPLAAAMMPVMPVRPASLLSQFPCLSSPGSGPFEINSAAQLQYLFDQRPITGG